MTSQVKIVAPANAATPADRSKSPITKLPHNLMAYLFTFLPAKEVLRGKLVCKGFSPGITRWQRQLRQVEMNLFDRYMKAKQQVPGSEVLEYKQNKAQERALAIQELKKMSRTLTLLPLGNDKCDGWKMNDLLSFFSTPHDEAGEALFEPLFPSVTELNLSLGHFDDTEPKQPWVRQPGTRGLVRGPIAPPLADKALVLKMLKSIGSHCPQLTRLVIQDADESEPLDVLLENCSNVTSLTLQNCDLHSEEFAKKLPKLREVRFINNSPKASAVVACSKVSQLKELDVFGEDSFGKDSIDDQTLQLFAGHRSLQIVRLSSCRVITNASLVSLAQIPNLTTLDLVVEQIKDLTALKGARCLTHLKLYCDSCILTFPHLATLQTLKLRWDQLSEKDLSILSSCRELRHLELDGYGTHKLTDQGLAYLAPCKALVSLKLVIGERGAVTTKAVIKLAEALPNLRELEITPHRFHRLIATLDLNQVEKALEKSCPELTVVKPKKD